MYNRYIPQSDGSFRRSRIAEQSPAPNTPPTPKREPPPITQESPPAKQKPPVTQESPPAKQEPPVYHTQQPSVPRHQRTNSPNSVSNFLKGLLPQNFDTEDLLVVVLLLLMSGNNSNDQNAALLTLGIYLFLIE